MNALTKFKSKIVLSLLTIGIGYFAFPNTALAGFGISPGMIIQEHLKPGATIEQEVVISRSDPDEDLVVKIEPELEEMESWFKFEPSNEIEMPKGQQNITVKIIINVPSNAKYKSHQGVIRIMGSPKLPPESGVSVVKGARMEVELITTKLDISQLIVRDMSFEKLKGNSPLKLNLKIENNGNTKVAPDKAVIEIADLQQRYIETLETDNLGTIAPNETQTITAQFDTTVGSGEYFANVEVFLEGKSIREDRLVFEVTDRAAGTRGQAMLTTALETFKQIGQNSLLLKTLGLSLAISGVVGLSNIKNRKKTSKKKLFTSGSVFSILAVFFAISLFFYNKDHKIRLALQQPPVNDNKDILTKEEEKALPVETEDSEKVEGSANSRIINTYKIFEKPSLTSEIVYEAQENETFGILETQTDWYRIKLPSGDTGWLHKQSILSIQEVEPSLDK